LVNWTNVATAAPDGSGNLQQTITPGSTTRTFYRYVYLVP
jgi:hypothetical protein